jgi:hypothetical protein
MMKESSQIMKRRAMLIIIFCFAFQIVLGFTEVQKETIDQRDIRAFRENQMFHNSNKPIYLPLQKKKF